VIDKAPSAELRPDQRDSDSLPDYAVLDPIIEGYVYALRNLVERCFSKLKHSRRLATRYDKTADSFIGFVLIASVRLWVRHFVDRT